MLTAFDPLTLSPGRERDPAVVGDGRRWSYGELREAVAERADRLQRQGRADAIGDADAAPVRAEPIEVDASLAAITEILAAWRAGLVPALLNTRLTEAERAAARSILARSELPPGACAVLWTSGTSGRPRGVALSSANLLAITVASRERLDLGSDDVWVASLSPAHVGGLVLVVRALLLGSAVIVPEGAGVAGLGSVLDDGAAGVRPTHASLVPTQLLHLLEHRGDRPRPPQLRCVLIGGAFAPTALVRRAVATGWPIALTYGATEMSSQIATAPPPLVRDEPGTVGAPMPGVELRVTASGELLARGPTRALGYVGTTAPPLADQDGWYHTGDLGRIDDDGHLWITGRRIDRIVTGGVTVDAIEVEEAIRTHPAVADACVVGVADEEWGERIAAAVVPVGGEFDLDDVDRHVRALISVAKIPRLWHLTSAIPRNANGKPDRIGVRGLF